MRVAAALQRAVAYGLFLFCLAGSVTEVDVATPDFITQTDRFGNATMPRSRSTCQGPKSLLRGIKLLPKRHPDDCGKKCLVLDLDETLVHASLHAVQGADFVIRVQIKDVVQIVYVVKRPGVDKFLVEMAKHFEIVIFTASLKEYADPLLDLLDPHRVIRTRLFRESCVRHEGNYVKDLSLLDDDAESHAVDDDAESLKLDEFLELAVPPTSVELAGVWSAGLRRSTRVAARASPRRSPRLAALPPVNYKE